MLPLFSVSPLHLYIESVYYPAVHYMRLCTFFLALISDAATTSPYEQDDEENNCSTNYAEKVGIQHAK